MPSSEHLIQFENRLRKMNAHLGKWARRQSITCYRIYDCDVPGFSFSIDRYEDHIYLCEFHQDKLTDEEQSSLLSLTIERIKDICQISEERIHFRSRKRQRGGTERGLDGEEKQGEMVVREGGHKFLVNLDSHLDTGLFLDHRNTRGLVQSQSSGKRVLNLFCYTGSFTVYAAAGGSISTLSVDLSKPYCGWAASNLRLNECDPQKNVILNADVMRYLAEEKPGKFDLIVLDPPTFSNSKKMRDTLDIKRDHSSLVNSALRLCASGGTIYFSCNLRNFKLKSEEIVGAVISDISKQTIPNDFRDSKIHHCYRITKA